MTIKSVVIAVVSVFAHLPKFGPLQALTTCAYTVALLKWNGNA